MKTLVIGAAIVDLIMKIQRLPQSGEDILCNEDITAIGGCAYNVAGILRNLNISHDLMVPVGKGKNALLVKEQLHNNGYEILAQDDGMDNGYCLCLVENDGERTFITVKGIESVFKQSWFEQIAAEQYQNIYVAGYQLCKESGKVISNWLATLSDKTIFFAPGPAITEIYKEVMDKLFSLRPIVHLNEKELYDYTKQATLEECLQHLYEKTQNLVIVTLGENGTAYYDGTGIHRVSGYKAIVTDTIGAGDSHIATVIAGISMGMDIDESISMANKVAAKIVSIQGSVVDKAIFKNWQII